MKEWLANKHWDLRDSNGDVGSESGGWMEKKASSVGVLYCLRLFRFEIMDRFRAQ